MKRYSLPASSLMFVSVALTLQACASHGAREVPSVGLPEQFHAQQAASTDHGYTEQWWTTLGDPALSDLITRAIADNPDIAAANARISAARAAMGVARAPSLPSVNVGGRVDREKISSNGLFGSVPGKAFPNSYTLYRTGLDASWELDVFGLHAAERRKATANHANAIADMNAVRLALTAEVARVYLEHVVLAQKLVSTQHVVNTQEQTVELVMQQYQAGQASEADVARARLALDSAKAQLPTVQAEVAVRNQAMGALLGTGEFVSLPDSSPILGDALQSVTPDLSVQAGLPAELLRRRPDIHMAEARFTAATANRDIAVADQYPHIALTAGAGLESLRQGSLFEAASKYWNIVPQISLPLFDGGRRRSMTAQRQAEVDAAMAEYRKAVINALTDVEQSLLRHRGANDALLANVAATQHAGELLNHQQARYAAGDISLVQLLDAQRQFETQYQLSLAAKEQALLSFLSLHKALGGEFEARTDQAGQVTGSTRSAATDASLVKAD